MALSAVSVVELTHGIYRARTDAQREGRKVFCTEILDDLTVYPITTEIAQIAGRVDGELSVTGIKTSFEDLLIAATALFLGFEIATLNTRHFESIPGIVLVTI